MSEQRILICSANKNLYRGYDIYNMNISTLFDNDMAMHNIQTGYKKQVNGEIKAIEKFKKLLNDD